MLAYHKECERKLNRSKLVTKDLLSGVCVIFIQNSCFNIQHVLICMNCGQQGCVPKFSE